MANPITQQDRMVNLDILRGLAILGILIVNMAMINTPYLYLEITGERLFTGIWDRSADTLILLFAQGKFYTMFSFLFGLGFILFMERAEQKVKSPKVLYLRRLLILFAFGFLHAYFFWWGDILMMYAIGGLILVLFYDSKPKSLIVWAIALITVFIFLITIFVGLATLIEQIEPGMFLEETSIQQAEYLQEIENSITYYGEGTYAEIKSQRLKDLRLALSSSLLGLLIILPMFLLGAFAGKKKIFQNIKQHIGFIKKVWFWSLILGVSLNMIKVWSGLLDDPSIPSSATVFNYIGMTVGDPALSLFYITSVILLLQSPIWKRRLTPLAFVGRMAITNYLVQTLVVTTIFYSYGLGLYGQVGPFLGVLLSAAIFIVQVYASRIWLAKFHYGPVEWLWRTLTYGKMQAFRKQ